MLFSDVSRFTLHRRMAGEEFSDHCVMSSIGVGTGGALGACTPQYFGSLIQILFQCPPPI